LPFWQLAFHRLTILAVTILADAMAFLIQQRISSEASAFCPAFCYFSM
jgi:hypothetical protein